MKATKKNQRYYLKDIIETIKSEKLEEDFCLYGKDSGELIYYGDDF